MKYAAHSIIVMFVGMLLSAQGALVLSYDAADLDLSGDAAGVNWAPAVSNGVSGMNFNLGAGSSVITPSSSYFSRSVSSPNSGNILSFKNAGYGSNATSDFSFEIWVKPTDLTSTNILFETGGTTIGTSILLVNDTLHFVYSTGGSPAADVTGVLASAPSDFIQIVGVTDVSAGLTLYVNGAPVNSASTTVGNWAGANGGHFGGTDSNVAKPAGFIPTDYDGELALARFYDTALSSTEVAAVYTSTSPEPATLGLIAFGGSIIFIRRRLMM